MEPCSVSSGTLWDTALTPISVLMVIWLPSHPSDAAFGNPVNAALPCGAGLLWSWLLGTLLEKLFGRDELFASRAAITSANLCCCTGMRLGRLLRTASSLMPMGS